MQDVAPPLRAMYDILVGLEWPACLCNQCCVCTRDSCPEWAQSFGSEHGLLKCLDFLETNLAFSDAFHSGLQHHSNTLGQTVKDRIAGMVMSLVFDDRKQVLDSKMATSEENLINYSTQRRGRELRECVSGVTCGMVINDMFTRWGYYLFQCHTESARDQELYVWINEAVKVTNKLEIIRLWLKDDSLCAKRPLQHEVWKGAVFWLLQWICYLVDDVRLLSTSSLEYATKRHSSGLLLWQLGWFQTDEIVCDAISAIMFANEKHV